MKKNNSIIQSEDYYCFIHREYLGIEVPAVHKHHTIHGVGRRNIAEREGCYVFLCMSCHNALHDKGFHDKDLQQLTEKKWLEINNKSVSDWIYMFGKNYL